MAAAASSSKASFLSLPDVPHHSKDFAFPKRTFGKSKPLLCSVQSQWFGTWPFLHYDEGKDVVFCHTCVTAVKFGLKSVANEYITRTEEALLLPFFEYNVQIHCVLFCS